MATGYQPGSYRKVLRRPAGAVLKRDRYACRVCGAPGRGEHTIAVHHRVPGRSLLDSMISLCLGCHARVHRTRAALAEMSPLLLTLWREQYPQGHEQTNLDFNRSGPAAVPVPLFGEADMLKP